MLALEGGGTRHQVWLCMRAAKLAWCHSRDLKASAKVCGLGGMDGRGKGGSVERKGLDLKNAGFGTCLHGMGIRGFYGFSWGSFYEAHHI